MRALRRVHVRMAAYVSGGGGDDGAPAECARPCADRRGGEGDEEARSRSLAARMECEADYALGELWDVYEECSGWIHVGPFWKGMYGTGLGLDNDTLTDRFEARSAAS